MIANGCISFGSRKQVALSLIESEYMALTDAAKEAIFLRRLFTCLIPIPLLFYAQVGTPKFGSFFTRIFHINIKVNPLREST